jgi:hypothetical protein
LTFSLERTNYTKGVLPHKKLGTILHFFASRAPYKGVRMDATTTGMGCWVVDDGF